MNAEQFDKHLFNLSQQAADDSAMPFNEEAWQRMEQLLDGDKKKRRFVLWWWLLPLLLVGGGTAMYLNDKNAGNATIASNNLKGNIEETKTYNQTTKTENKVEEKVSLNTLNKSIAETNNSNKDVIKKTDDYLKGNTNAFPAKASQFLESAITTNTSSKYKNKIKKYIKSGQSVNLNTVTTKNASLNAEQFVNTNTSLVVDNAANNNNNTNLKVDIAVIVNVNTINENQASKGVDTMAKPSVITKKDTSKKKTSLLSKFEFSAFAAADISSTNLSIKNPKSPTLGISLSYQITKKLSIATGFGMSKKLYSVDSAEYKNKPWMPASYKLKTVDANCLVYELPINLQYQFAQSKKASWLAVGGVSSYFMKSEEYDYNYMWYAQPRKTTYDIEDKNNHLFSILNVAVGYRRQLGKQLSYQLTPFVKIPLTGIGEGQVKLYSAGLQLSLNLKGK